MGVSDSELDTKSEEFEAAKLQALGTRRAYKTVVSKVLGELKKIPRTSRNVMAVVEKLSKLHDASMRFDKAHDDYHSRLYSRDEVDASRQYHNDVFQSVRMASSIAHDWIEQIRQELKDRGIPVESPPESSKGEVGYGFRESGMSFADELQLEADKAYAAKSQHGSSGSNSSGVVERSRIRVMAEKAALEAEAEVLAAQQAIEAEIVEIRSKRDREDLLLRQKTSQLELQAKLARAEAQEKVYSGELTGAKPKRSSVRFSLGGPDFSSTPRTGRSRSLLKDTKAPDPKVHKALDDDGGRVDTSASGAARSTRPSHIMPDEADEMSATESMMRHMLDHTSVMQQTMAESLRLPKCELQVFDGDPIKYYPFICSFEASVHRDTVSYGDKLTRLLQFCSGTARRVIESCAVMTPEAGYQRARELLRLRFGDPFVISERWIERIEKLPEVTNRRSLQVYADELLSCRETLGSMGQVSELNHSRSLLRLVQKLPPELHKAWATKVDRITVDGKRALSVDDLLDYVINTARMANHPVFGDLYMFKDRLSMSKQREVSRKGNISKVSKPSQSYVTQSVTLPRSKSAEDTGRMDPHGKSGRGKVKYSSISDSAAARGVRSRQCIFCNANNHSLYNCSPWKALSVTERLNFVQTKGLCVNCLRADHKTRECEKTGVCPIVGCGKRHTVLLHLPRSEDERSEHKAPVVTSQISSKASPVKSCDMSNPNSTSGHYVANSDVGKRTDSEIGKIGLPIVPIKARAKDGEYTQVYALLDTGSTQTFCTEELAGKLGLVGEHETMLLTTLEEKGKSVSTAYVNLEVSDLRGLCKVELNRIATRASLNIDANMLVTSTELKRWKHLREIELPMAQLREVHLLIGQDNASLFVPIKVRKGKYGEPYAVLTVLGWTIHGRLREGSKRTVSHYVDTDGSLSQQVERFWKLDNLGDEHDSCMSPNERKVIQIWENSMVFSKGHFAFDIPFKSRPPSLLNNRCVAEKRLKSLASRLSKDERFSTRYKLEMDTLVLKGYAERVPAELLGRADGKVWYIPHHPVLNEKKPDKVRPVFDCAARYGGYSLNEQVYQGPDLTNNLVGVLLRFRQDQVAFMADIEAMFHQVFVTPDDRDTLRYLWWEGKVGDDSSIKEYRMTAHLFGGVWSPSVANYAVRSAADRQATNYGKEAVETVYQNFYVDDCLKSVADEATAVRLIGQVKGLLASGGFNLTKWVSNSREVLKSIPESERAKNIKILDLDCDHLPIERALGLLWDVENDNYTYNTKAKDKPLTKRGLLSIVCSVYDPLGFVSPFIMSAKMIFQALCRQHIDWDDAIPEMEALQWGRWLESLLHLRGFAIPRCIKPVGEAISVQLHHFCDASEKAYGAVTYMRTINKDGQIYCKLLVAKGRLTPLKTMTIPRLELTAAVLSVQLDKTVRLEMKLEFLVSKYWSDSTIVLHYIQNLDRRYQTFVANRLEKIRDHSDPSQWNHVETNVNPADIISRGSTAEVLIAQRTWITGPEFLWKPESEWPEQPIIIPSALCSRPEIKRETPVFSCNSEPQVSVIELMAKHYSNWYKFRKAVAWMLRYRSYLLCKKGVIRENLTVSEINEAEIVIIKDLQAPYLRNSNNLRRVNPVLNRDSVLCVEGRLRHSSLPDRAKHPWILPGRGHIAEMLVKHYHLQNGHAGVERTLADIGQLYWLVNGRSLVKKVVYNCIPCRKLKAKVKPSRMSDLPADRVSVELAPFTNVGIDYFGPFMVKRGRATVKRYGCIFTCLITRAIHLEVSGSLDTSSFINALQRFIARRGPPKQIRSDNGTNFVGAEKELRLALREWNQDKINDFLRQKGIIWQFNPPAASHMGGVWERLIRSIRAVLRGLVLQQLLDDEGLTTLMCLVEGIINGRPLTKLSDDPNDDTPLTPNHLLMLRGGPSGPPGKFDKGDLCGKRWRQVQYLADVFWKRWAKEYLPRLQERQKWLKYARNFRPGDLVMVTNEQLPRHHWPLGLILEALPGRDGQVRVVKLKFQGHVYERPTSKLILLEGSPQGDDDIRAFPIKCIEQ